MPIEPSSSWLDKIFRSMYPEEPVQFPYVDPPPSAHRPEIPVVGDKDLAREMYMYAKKHPRIAGNVSRVSLGPTSASMRKMVNSNLPIDEFENTNLLGIYDLNNRGIGINPVFNEYSPQRSQVLGHELGHSLGIMNENMADRAGEVWRDYYSRNPYGSRK